MKLSEKTLTILSNFANINQSIKFKGNQIKTLSGDISKKSIQAIAMASIDENIDEDVAIYNLPEFLGLLKLYNDSEYSMTFNSKDVVIKSDKWTTKFNYCNPEIISDVPLISTDAFEVLVEFDMTKGLISEIKKICGALTLSGFYFKNEKSKLELHFYDATKLTSKPSHVIKTGFASEADFDPIYFEMSNFYIEPNTSYKVKLTQNMVHFKSDELGLEYFIVTSNEPK